MTELLLACERARAGRLCARAGVGRGRACCRGIPIPFNTSSSSSVVNGRRARIRTSASEPGGGGGGDLRR